MCIYIYTLCMYNNIGKCVCMYITIYFICIHVKRSGPSEGFKRAGCVPWAFCGRGRHGEQLLRIAPHDYFVGKASGEGCNCLIQSLRQCLNIVTNGAMVRSDHMKKCGSAVGRARVGTTQRTLFGRCTTHTRAHETQNVGVQDLVLHVGF